MEYAALLNYLIQAVRFALKGLAAGSQARAIFTQIDADLTAMQAEGNRPPNEAERAKMVALLETLAAQPAQE